MRQYIVAFFVLIFLSMGASQVYYEGNIQSADTRINMSMQLNCDEGNCPVTSWTVTMKVPESAEIIDVHSARGDVIDTRRQDDNLIAESKTVPSESEQITVVYDLQDEARNVHSGLLTRRINLPGFDGEANTGRFSIEDLLSASSSDGFQISADGDEINFTGEGPGNIVVASGEGYPTRYFEFFGAEPGNTSISYEVTAGTLGFNQGFERLPVAVMPEEKYEEQVNNWSAGQYTNATLVLRDDLEEDFLPILAHEAVHSFNDQRFNWDGDSSWFDEGTARYVEFLVKKALQGDEKTRSLFGEEKTYIEFEDGSRYRYTVPPKGNRDVLWEYYQNDQDFMKYWNTEIGNRDFGYAYSELIIRNYVSQNNSIDDLYNSLDIETSSDAQKWQELSQEMDLTPCKYDELERFEGCLERINDYNYPVYRAENLTKSETSIAVKKLELPERRAPERGSIISNGSGNSGNVTSTEAISGIFGNISALISDIIKTITG